MSKSGDSMVDNFLATLRQVARAASSNDREMPGRMADRVFEFVSKAQPEPPLIKWLVTQLAEEAYAAGVEGGMEQGRGIERREHPAIRAMGEAVRTATRLNIDAALKTAAEVYEAEINRGANPTYAHLQAMEAIGGTR